MWRNVLSSILLSDLNLVVSSMSVFKKYYNSAQLFLSFLYVVQYGDY